MDRSGVGTVRPTAVAGSSSHEPTAAGGEGTFFFRVLVFAVAVARFVRALLDFAGVSVMRMPFPNVAFDLNHNYSAQKVRYERLPATRSRRVPTRGHGGQALPSLIVAPCLPIAILDDDGPTVRASDVDSRIGTARPPAVTTSSTLPARWRVPGRRRGSGFAPLSGAACQRTIRFSPVWRVMPILLRLHTRPDKPRPEG